MALGLAAEEVAAAAAAAQQAATGLELGVGPARFFLTITPSPPTRLLAADAPAPPPSDAFLCCGATRHYRLAAVDATLAPCSRST